HCSKCQMAPLLLSKNSSKQWAGRIASRYFHGSFAVLRASLGYGANKDEWLPRALCSRPSIASLPRASARRILSWRNRFSRTCPQTSSLKKVLTIQTSEWLCWRKSDGGDGQSEDHDHDPQRNDRPHLRSFHRFPYIVIHVEPRSLYRATSQGLARQ